MQMLGENHDLKNSVLPIINHYSDCAISIYGSYKIVSHVDFESKIENEIWPEVRKFISKSKFIFLMSKLKHQLDEYRNILAEYESVACFISDQTCSIVPIRIKVEQLFVIDKSFYIKPIIRSFQKKDSFHLLLDCDTELQLWEASNTNRILKYSLWKTDQNMDEIFNSLSISNYPWALASSLKNYHFWTERMSSLGITKKPLISIIDVHLEKTLKSVCECLEKITDFHDERNFSIIAKSVGSDHSMVDFKKTIVIEKSLFPMNPDPFFKILTPKHHLHTLKADDLTEQALLNGYEVLFSENVVHKFNKNWVEV